MDMQNGSGGKERCGPADAGSTQSDRTGAPRRCDSHMLGNASVGSMTEYAFGERYAVVSGCAEASYAAAACLDAGGSVVDAAIAASAVLCVVLPQSTALGGDLFALVRQEPGGHIFAVNASGGAPHRATVEAYRRLGQVRVPSAGPLSIQAPGLVAGWQALADRWARRPLAELLDPAIRLAHGGSRVGARLATAIANRRGIFGALPGWRSLFAPGGQWLTEGDSLVQTALARTLQRIAERGARGFYEGPVARDIAQTVQHAGGLLEEDDLTAVKAEIVPPLAVRYRDVEVLTQPPVSQGAVLLRALRLLALDVPCPRALEEAELWARAARTLRQAFEERLALLGDRGEARAAAMAMVDGRREGPAVAGEFTANPGPDTTTVSVIDASGNAAALIQSVYSDFGSGVLAAESGVLLNNRLSAFFLDPKHPNCLAPRRRTMHTLHTFMVRDAEALRWAGGSPGADHQPQVNLQVLVRLIDLGQAPSVAVAAPRWSTTPGTKPDDLAAASRASVQCEGGVTAEMVQAFIAAGFDVVQDSGIQLGSSKLIGEGPHRGSVAAWADRRREGFVVAR